MNPIRQKGIDCSLIKRKVKVYDVAQKLLLGEFESCRDAAKYCGLKSGHISSYIKYKSRNHHNSLGITICFR